MAKSKLDDLRGKQISGYEIHQYWSEGDGILMSLHLIFSGKIVTLDDIIDSTPLFPGSFALHVRNATYSTAHIQNGDVLLDEKVTFIGRPYYLNNVERHNSTCIVKISNEKN